MARERHERQIWEQEQKARQATGEFADHVRYRADWMADSVIDFRPTSPVIVSFVSASYLHLPQVLKPVSHQTEPLAAAELEQLWKAEGERRLELISQVKKLAALSHAPRKSRRWQLRRLGRRAVSLLATARLKHRSAGQAQEPAADGQAASD